MNYNSTDPKDFVEVLNKIADAMGGVSNMGVFADITSVTQSNEMIANVADPYQFDLDTLVGKKGSNIPSILESFLSKVDKLVIAETKAVESPASSTKSEDRSWADKDDELPEEDEEDDDEKDDEEDDTSVSEAFREVGKEFSSAFKETGRAFKDAFKFK